MARGPKLAQFAGKSRNTAWRFEEAIRSASRITRQLPTSGEITLPGSAPDFQIHHFLRWAVVDG